MRDIALRSIALPATAIALGCTAVALGSVELQHTAAARAAAETGAAVSLLVGDEIGEGASEPQEEGGERTGRRHEQWVVEVEGEQRGVTCPRASAIVALALWPPIEGGADVALRRLRCDA